MRGASDVSFVDQEKLFFESAQVCEVIVLRGRRWQRRDDQVEQVFVPGGSGRIRRGLTFDGRFAPPGREVGASRVADSALRIG